MSNHRSPAVTRMRDATLLAASTLTVMAGAAIAPALPKLQGHFSSVEDVQLLVKLVLTLPALAIALTAPFMGWLGDKVGFRTLLTTSTFAFVAAGTSGLYLGQLPAILLGRFALGLSVAGVMTSVTALIAIYFNGEARKRFLGYQMATASFGGLLFLTLGGVLSETGWRLPFAVYFAGLPVALATVTVLPAPQPPDVERPTAAGSGTKTSWPIIGLVSFVSLLGMTAFYLIPTQIPFYFSILLSAGSTLSGVAIGSATFFGGLASLANARISQRLGVHNTLALSFAFMAACFMLLGMHLSISSSFLALSLGGVGTGMLMPNLTFLVVSNASSSVSGRAAGLLTSSMFFGQFLSPVVSEPTASAIGLPATFGIASGLSLLVAISIVAGGKILIKSKKRWRATAAPL